MTVYVYKIFFEKKNSLKTQKTKKNCARCKIIVKYYSK